MKVNSVDFSGKSMEEVKESLEKMLREQFDLRMALGTGQLSQVHLIKQTRRNIARMKTLVNIRREGRL